MWLSIIKRMVYHVCLLQDIISHPQLPPSAVECGRRGLLPGGLRRGHAGQVAAFNQGHESLTPGPTLPPGRSLCSGALVFWNDDGEEKDDGDDGREEKDDDGDDISIDIIVVFCCYYCYYEAFVLLLATSLTEQGGCCQDGRRAQGGWVVQQRDQLHRVDQSQL